MQNFTDTLKFKRLMRLNHRELVGKLGRQMWCLDGKVGRVIDKERKIHHLSKSVLAERLYWDDVIWCHRCGRPEPLAVMNTTDGFVCRGCWDSEGPAAYEHGHWK